MHISNDVHQHDDWKDHEKDLQWLEINLTSLQKKKNGTKDFDKEEKKIKARGKTLIHWIKNFCPIL